MAEGVEVTLGSRAMTDRRVRLGEITCPSGELFLFDFGCMDLWCHDRPVVFPDGWMDEAATRTANAAADYRIDGPDAEAAGRKWDRQWHPRYVYDIPAHAHEQVQAGFAEVCRENGFRAELVKLPERVTHRERAAAALLHGNGAGISFLSGMHAVVVAGLPTDRPLPVFASRMGGSDETVCDRWELVELDVRPRSRVARREAIGPVTVDKARLFFADLHAVGGWEHDRPLDGQADFLIWGKDAPLAARALNIPKLSDDTFGWLNGEVGDVARKGMQVEQQKEKRGWKMATDFRPHSHHYHLMKPLRETPTQSGCVEVNGATVCGFNTTWGDGFFPVWREVTVTGELVRVGIQLGDDERVKLIHKLYER
jgi:hypothetical protein